MFSLTTTRGRTLLQHYRQGLFCLLVIVLSIIAFPSMAASPLVADLSNYHIEMDSGFNGTRIFLFGARNDNGDVVVVVRGPDKDYIVRKKEKIGGIWINRQHMNFFGVPDFYAIAASKSLTDIEQDTLFKRLRIGQDSLLVPPRLDAPPANFSEFSTAFAKYQHKRNLYMESPQKVSFMGEMLFKTTIDFPDNTPPGDYTAEIYLISGGEITGMQSTPITVVKSGVDAFVYSYAHTSPLLYGITAIVLALFVGWFGGRLFEKI